MAIADLDSISLTHNKPAPKLALDMMLSGILEAIVFTAGAADPERRSAQLTIERDLRTGFVKVTERVSGIGGDERRDLRDAVESLYLRLTEEAAAEERRAIATLNRLGART